MPEQERSIMLKVLVLFYSRTGNTEKMAKAIVEGAKTAGDVLVELSYYIDADELSNFDAIFVGAPTYHHDMPIDIKMLFEESAARNVNLKGKTGAVFGSYGWSGEAPNLVLEILKNKFEMHVPEKPLLARYAPNSSMLDECKALGKRLAENPIHQK
jgi:flavorubredoxin